ncbi:MAG: hypothetical protein H7330_09320 [Hymenobacteraceae bacterium]|nr:hypothetical protein [Hymenobacteraceae bacterium]
MRLLSTLLPAALVLTALLGGCASENLEDMTGAPVGAPCDTTAVATYSGVVQPILIKYECTACHRTGGIGALAFPNLNYETPAGLISAVRTGRLLGAIEHKSGFAFMPQSPRPKMSDCDIARVKQWVRRGALAD